MHMLLQILEEGRLTDSLGRHVDFRNTVVILTSNLGFDFAKQGRGLGFSVDTTANDYERLKAQLMNEAKQVFKPELLNRFDDIIVFRKLDKPDVVRILEIELAKVRARLVDRGVNIELSDAASAFLVDKGFDPALGARPLRRAVERYLEDPFAEELLRSNDIRGTVEVGVNGAGDALTFNFQKPGDASAKTADEPVKASAGSRRKKTSAEKL